MTMKEERDDHAELRPLLRRGFQSRGFGHPCWELGTAKSGSVSGAQVAKELIQQL